MGILKLGNSTVTPCIVLQYIPRVLTSGKLEMPSGTLVFDNSITELGYYVMAYAFFHTSITSIDFNNVTTLGANALYHAFDYSEITTANVSSLTTASGNYNMQYCFRRCYSLTTITFSSLVTLTGGYCMQYCFEDSAIQNIYFPALTSTSFGSRVSQFNDMLRGVTGCTVHFPSNLQSVIGNWDSVVAGFGGTNTTVLFNLTATE